MQPQHRDLYLWWPCLHSRVAAHKGRRRNHLRLRERLPQIRDRAFALSMQTMPEKASPQTESGACGKEAPHRTAGADAPQKTLKFGVELRRLRSPAIRFWPCPQ